MTTADSAYGAYVILLHYLAYILSPNSSSAFCAAICYRRTLAAGSAYTDNIAVEPRLDGEHTLVCGSRLADGYILEYLTVLLLNELLKNGLVVGGMSAREYTRYFSPPRTGAENARPPLYSNRDR